MNAWIGVDLDGTLADYSEWKGPEHIGAPIPLMVERVKAWLGKGREVRVFTARVALDEDGTALAHIETWCEEHIGQKLPVTNAKDYGMIEMWDDRCVQVIPNTGRRADQELLRLALEHAQAKTPITPDRARGCATKVVP